MNQAPGCNILHVELAGGIPALPAPPDGRGIYVVFWWQGVPVGDWYVPFDSVPVPRSRVADFATPLVPEEKRSFMFESARTTGLSGDVSSEDGISQLDDPMVLLQPGSIPVGANPPPDDAVTGGDSISLVICTRDRPEQLEQCLRSLDRLTASPQEIVVVDNASQTSETRRVAEAFPGVLYVHEPRPGLDIGRNTGARSSNGDIVAYVDDDALVHPDFLRGILRGFKDPSVMAVTGLVLPSELETHAQVIFETHWSFNKGFQARTFDRSFFDQHASSGVPVWEIGAGTNMAFRRKVFGLVGFFDERLDVGAAGCSGDSEYWFRVLAEGWLCRYEPSAVVFHTHRRDLTGLKRQIYSYMRGATAAHLIQYQKYGQSGDLRRPLLTLPRWYLQRLAERVRGRSDLRTPTFFSEVRGFLSGLLFYLRNRRTPADAVAPRAGG
jgi:GT2 family glycosyltransferase